MISNVPVLVLRNRNGVISIFAFSHLAPHHLETRYVSKNTFYAFHMMIASPLPFSFAPLNDLVFLTDLWPVFRLCLSSSVMRTNWVETQITSILQHERFRSSEHHHTSPLRKHSDCFLNKPA